MDELQMHQQMIYTPGEFADVGVKAIERMRANQSRALAIGIPLLRDYLAPALPGELVIVLAQTSNYKTGFMENWQDYAATQLDAQGRDEIIVSISLEDTVESQAHMAFARESGEDAGQLARGVVNDWNDLLAAALRTGTKPILHIGDSMARDIGYEHFYLSNIFAALDFARSGKLTGKALKFAAVFVDYLQALPFDPDVRKQEMKEQRRLQVRNDVYRLRDAGKHFDCPQVVAVQAKQTMTGALGLNMQTPGVYDGEETSSIAQRAARLISLWMPKTTHRVGQTIEHGGLSFRVEENLLWVRVCKQQGRLPAGRIFPNLIDFRTNAIMPVEL